jgi:hypothetical protein
MKVDIESANRKALEKLNNAQPVLIDIKTAHEAIPDMDKRTILHAGPPLEWKDMCGPLKGSIIGGVRYEALVETEEEALALIESGEIKFFPNHNFDAVGPMTGIISYSMPVYVVKNEAYGNVAYCTINEGLGKVMRFGAKDDEVLKRLKWIETELAPGLKKAIIESGGINLKVTIAQALTMGDEMHQRNIAASSLFVRKITLFLVKTVKDNEALTRITEFIIGNDQFFLNLAMAAGKATMDPVRDISGSTVVTAMSRNGTNFGIRVSGLGNQWFEAPVLQPKGLYFPGYTETDANPDIGDSSIIETFGLGGFAMAAAPAVTQFVGAGSVDDAINYSRDMGEITLGKSPHYILPTMDFEGTPTGIDICKVIETGILPVINTGIAHKNPGVGQVGAGIVNPPIECFKQALIAFDEKYTST